MFSVISCWLMQSKDQLIGCVISRLFYGWLSTFFACSLERPFPTTLRSLGDMYPGHLFDAAPNILVPLEVLFDILHPPDSSTSNENKQLQVSTDRLRLLLSKFKSSPGFGAKGCILDPETSVHTRAHMILRMYLHRYTYYNINGLGTMQKML